jgi:hypothetical protein
MYQKTTQNELTDYCKIFEKENVSGLVSPRKETLVLIMQFAAAYHVEKKLPDALSGIVLN